MMETVVLEAVVRDWAPPRRVHNPFKGKQASGKTTKTDADRRLLGHIQLVTKRSTRAGTEDTVASTRPSHWLRFLMDAPLTNEMNWPLYVLLARADTAQLPDDTQLARLEAEGEIVPLDIGPDGQWVGAQMPNRFEQELFVFDALAFRSVAICKPSACRPPSATPLVVAYGAFQAYLPPEKSPRQLQAEMDALAKTLQNTVMEMEHSKLQSDDDLDLDSLQRSAKELFRLFDQDRSNSIDFEEYKQMLMYRGLNLLDAKAMRLFQLVDDQKKGYIDEREFVVAIYITNALRKTATKRKDATPAVLSPVDVFYQLDRDRDERLNLFECERGMQLLGVAEASTASRVRTLLPKGASSITLDEFKSVWLQLIDVEYELKRRGVTVNAAESRQQGRVDHTPQQSVARNVEAPIATNSRWRLLSLPLPFGSTSKQRQQQHLRHRLVEAITKAEEEEMSLAISAKEEVVRLEREKREREQGEKRALFAVQRQTETSTRTTEALRERQDKIIRRKERVIKERQEREERRLMRELDDEQEKRAIYEREVVHELMATKVERQETQKAIFADDILDLSTRGLDEVPVSLYKGRDSIASLSSLLIVNLSDNRLGELPGDLCSHLISLQVLDLSNNVIEVLPQEIGELHDLKTFDLRNNRLRELPEQMKYLRNLNVLNVAYNRLTCFGEHTTNVDIGHGDELKKPYCSGLVALEELSLDGNTVLEAISDSVGDLRSLQVLRVRGCPALKRLPDAVNQMRSLMILDVAASNMKRIGKHVLDKGLVNLRIVDISFNALTGLPESLGLLPNLQELDITNNALISLPREMSGLRELVIFRAANNKLERLPESIGGLYHVEELILASNQLTALPDTIGLLQSSLRSLDLRNNRIREIPMEFGALDKLCELDMSWNELHALPDEIGCLASLVKLNLSHNHLRILPETISLWQELEILQCSHNALSTPLIESFQELHAVQYVDLSNNALTGLEICVSKLPNIKVLNLSGNKLMALPKEFVDSPAAQSLKKLDVYNNKLKAIPVEWAPLLSQLEVFSIGRNPMSLLPEKWSDQWRRQDQYTSGVTNGYTTPQVKEWIQDQSVLYPVIVSTWKRWDDAVGEGKPQPSSDAFLEQVQEAFIDEQQPWQNRWERVVRYYYYEFLYLGHEIDYGEYSEGQHERFTVAENRAREQRESRAALAIASDEQTRQKVLSAYHVDQNDASIGLRAAEKRRAHEHHLLSLIRSEARHWNELVSERYDQAEKRSNDMVKDRQRVFATEMKTLARQRVQQKFERRDELHALSEGVPASNNNA